jgi:hypothetical protein
MRTIHHKFKKATATSRGKLVVSLFFLVLLLAIIGAVVYWQTNKGQLIRDKLESAIEKKSGGFYTIQYENLELDEITGFLSMSNLTITYDSLKLAALKNAGIMPALLVSVHIPQIIVEGVKTPKALIDHQIEGRKLEIRNPVIEIIYTMQGKDSARKAPSKEFYREILGGLDEIDIDTVSISNAHISTRNTKTNRPGVDIVNANLTLTDLLVDSVANADTTRFLFAKQLAATCGEISWLSENKLYRFIAKGISIHSSSRSADIKNFSVVPQAGETAFVNSLETQDDRLDFAFQDLQFRNLDIPELLNDGLSADTLRIANAAFKIYRDLNIPRDRKNRVGSYPHQILAKLPISIDVGKLVVDAGYLRYKERNHITKKAGEVEFHNIRAEFRNVTNKSKSIAKNNIMNVDVNCRFLNKAPFRVGWAFNLEKNNGQFNVKGSLGTIRATDLNSLTEPMGPARVEKGTINKLDFNFTGNNYRMNGTLVMSYENLKVALLEKDKGSTEWDKKSIGSFVANLLIKNSNPRDEDEEPVMITVKHERDPNRSIFNFTWKSMFSAITQTVGVKQKNR